MRQFSLLVKPAGAGCNLACPYCFYRGGRDARSPSRMSDAILARMLETYRELPIAEHSVAFQGGEPLLMGDDFFRRAAELGDGVSFSVQTNATLVTDSLALFFADEGWLAGVSPHGGTPEFRRGYDRLVSAGVAVNVLQLVTKSEVREPEKLYHYIRDELGCMNHQYIECTSPEQFAVSGGEWGDFMVRIFDEWQKCGDVHRVSVRTFDSLVSQMLTGVPTLCQFANDCRHCLVVEANGDVFPCDFYVEPDLCLGNVMRDSWESIVESPAYAEFGARKRGHPDCPRNCHALDDGWRRFYAHAVARLKN
jgi:uncharacterized protein